MAFPLKNIDRLIILKIIIQIMNEILLGSSKSITSVNEENQIRVNLQTDSQLLPYSSLSEKLSLYQLYVDERDASKKYRMIFTINPICTNVLFNNITEIVWKEGSDECEFVDKNKKEWGSANDKWYINKSFNRLQAIRDTEYSHPDLTSDEVSFGYLCGLDLFNNHLLRNKEFVSIQRIPDRGRAENFNTISDHLRDSSGTTIEEKLSYGIGGGTNIEPTQLHLYQYDTINSMYDGYLERLEVENGWYGFINNAAIEIPNVIWEENGEAHSVSVNRVINSRRGGEFVDLYPDRTLFSFIPKVNTYRKRIEKNWDYCLMYPFNYDRRKLREILGLNGKGTMSDIAIKIAKLSCIYADNGNELVQCISLFKHTFKVNDIIRFYKVEGNTLKKINKKVKIVSVGDAEGNYTDKIFSVRRSDCRNLFGSDGDDLSDLNLYYKKEVNGIECEYYLRLFKKITKSDGINIRQLESNINKIAFGENIYGDRVAQIIFTDDVDIDGMKDYLKRPLHEIYLTVVKTNRGKDIWYSNPSDEKVEYSHCFGDVTSGLDLFGGLDPEEYDNSEQLKKYNIHCLHNVNLDEFDDNTKDIFESLNEKPEAIESGITLSDESTELYGDIVEFSPSEYQEVVIEPIYHRFNTLQRECKLPDKMDSNIIDDEIEYDDYDGNVNQRVRARGTDSFSVKEKKLNSWTDENHTINDPAVFAGNICPEGYYYLPHNKVVIGEVSESLQEIYATVIQYTVSDGTSSFVGLEGKIDDSGMLIYQESLRPDYYAIKIRLKSNRKLIVGETLGFYYKKDGKTYWGTIIEINGDEYNIGFPIKYWDERVGENNTIYNGDLGLNISDFKNGQYILLYSEATIPEYAVYLPNSHKFVWRDILKPSELDSDSDLYNMPFTNGRHYIEQNINFFLRRQDPEGKYGLLNAEKEEYMTNELKLFKVEGNPKIDFSGVIYQGEQLNNLCY